jgi:cytochrome c5
MLDGNTGLRPLLLLGIGLIGTLAGFPTLADDRCLACHTADALAEFDAETIQEAIKDSKIPAHGLFADLTEEEVKALLEALAK